MDDPIVKTNGARQLRFSPEITLGNLLQLVSMAAALVALWTSVDKRIAAVELRENFAVEERRDLKTSIATMAESQAVLTRTVDRVSILMDQQKGATK